MVLFEEGELSPEQALRFKKSGLRSIKAQEHLSVRPNLPKTKISHAILHENKSQDRCLDLNLNKIQGRVNRYVSNFENSRRSFLYQQSRKHQKWRQQDEMRTSSMNFPNIASAAILSPGVEVLYQSPQYLDEKNGSGEMSETLLPYMHLRRERTEILKLTDNKVYLTRLPTVIEINRKEQNRYNKYCGKKFLRHGSSLDDLRFRKLQESLSSGGLTDQSDEAKSESLSLDLEEDDDMPCTPRLTTTAPQTERSHLKHPPSLKRAYTMPRIFQQQKVTTLPRVQNTPLVAPSSGRQ